LIVGYLMVCGKIDDKIRNGRSLWYTERLDFFKLKVTGSLCLV